HIILKAVKFFSKLSLVALIFFSLQGEVVQRYVDLFQGKLEHRTSVPKKTAERHQLIKLQCYTQKFVSVALPFNAYYEFSLPIRSVTKIDYIITDSELIELADTTPPSLRGPPSINS
ncbi:MAG: hypothetical protein JWR67_2490, partial [Mucilaginibacter sp.]|nr:hypothetical protein [Mucilaginibacter sp.]